MVELTHLPGDAFSMRRLPLLSIVSVCFCFALLLPGCQSSSGHPGKYPAKPTIHIYGNPACPHCAHFVAQVKAHELGFQFHDIGSDRDAKATMWALIKKHHPGEMRVGLPIVQYNKKVYIRPDFEAFKKVYDSTP